SSSAGAMRDNRSQTFEPLPLLRRLPPGGARSARVRGDYSPGIAQLAIPFVLPFISSRVYIYIKCQCSAMNAVQNGGYIAQNCGAGADSSHTQPVHDRN